MTKIKLQIFGEPEVMKEQDFIKARVDNKWAVFTPSGIQDFIKDIEEMHSVGDVDDSDLEKAKKDLSQLIPKIIVDSIGRRKTVYVKPLDASAGADPAKSDIETAIEKYKHSVMTQKMSRNAAIAHLERHFGKDIAGQVRQWAENRRSDRSDSAAQAKDKKSPAPARPTEKKPVDDFSEAIADGEGVVFITADRKRIKVHQNAARGVSVYSPTGKTLQKDIESLKTAFISHMDEEGIPNKSAARAFHAWLKDGDSNLIFSNGDKDGGYFTYSMRDIIETLKGSRVEPVTEFKSDEATLDPEKAVTIGSEAVLDHHTKKQVKVKVMGEASPTEFYVKPLTFDVVPKTAILIVKKTKLTAFK